MTHVLISRNGEEYFNKLLGPDPDPGPDHLVSDGELF